MRASPAPGGAPCTNDAERQLAALARARGPLRRALTAVAARFVAVRGWERLGFARLRDYAIERLGLSARQLQDLAHVHEELTLLPRLEAALVAGEIPWTKARLLARVAEPEDEERWIAFAKGLTARALAREVRAVDVGALEAGAAAPCDEVDEDGAPADVREGVQIRCTPAVRAKWFRARQLARRVAGEALPVWEAMEAVAAEMLSAIPLDADAALDVAPLGAPARPANGCATDATWRISRRRRQRVAALLSQGCAEPDAKAAADDPFELDCLLRRALAREQRLEAQMGPLLLEVAERRLYRARGYANLEEYVRDRLGMSPRKARALLRLERVGRRSPELLAAYRAGRLSWVQAHALVPVILLDPSKGVSWIAWARRVAVRRLEEDVERALVRPERQTGARSTGCDETARVFFSAPRDVARLFRAVLCTVRRRIERHTGRLPSPGEGLEAMLDHVFEAWGAHGERVSREHWVFARDGWRCTVPACSSYRNLHDHHIVYRSAGGSDELANRTTLCAWHHLRGVHQGRVRVGGTAPNGLRFELGLRGDGPPLVSYRSGDLCDVREPGGLPSG